MFFKKILGKVKGKWVDIITNVKTNLQAVIISIVVVTAIIAIQVPTVRNKIIFENRSRSFSSMLRFEYKFQNKFELKNGVMTIHIQNDVKVLGQDILWSYMTTAPNSIIDCKGLEGKNVAIDYTINLKNGISRLIVYADSPIVYENITLTIYNSETKQSRLETVKVVIISR